MSENGSAQTGAGLFRGVDHVGIGVGDADEGIEFYGQVGFSDVLFDHTGEIPGTEAFGNGRPVRARVAMLANPDASPVGPSRVKLVHVLDGAPAAPAGQAWGEVGVCEICLHVRDVAAVHERLTALPGCESLMEPQEGMVVPFNVMLDIAYIADPWGGKIEMIEWKGLWKHLPGPPRAEGINHVAFGVGDMATCRSFYERMGFGEMLFESFEFFEPMAPWYDREIPDQHMVMLMSGQGGAIEPCRLTPLGPDCRGEWGHVGPMEFAVGVSNLERASEWLRAQGVDVHAAQSVDVGSGDWRYAYVTDPDGLYVALVEPRY
jgi:catechol 2,3-dioxygenase-like lactoylglutathione lyase family enzyme